MSPTRDAHVVGDGGPPRIGDAEAIREAVRQRYERLATAMRPSTGADERALAYLRSFYAEEEIAMLPTGIRGLATGCGNPGAMASLQPGMTLVDLGAGAGIDVFLAAARVGPSGRVIGVDISPAMVESARAAAKAGGYANIEFFLGAMEDLPLGDEAVDVVISNCAINQSPDKERVFGEAYRVLRPGGMLAVSDMVTVRDLPATLVDDPVAWSSCVAGAVTLEDYVELIRNAGFMRPVVRELETYSLERISELKEVDRTLLGPDQVLSPHELAGLDGCLASVRVQTLKVKTCCC